MGVGTSGGGGGTNFGQWAPLIGTAIDIGVGAVTSGAHYRKQRKLMEQQAVINKRMMDWQKQNQMDLWHATNYGPQKREMEKAGLNPALMYGMGGGGGATTGSFSGGAGLPSAQMQQTHPMDMGAMMGLLQAQKANIEADTAKKQAETAKTAGVDTIEAESRIQQIGANIGNVKAQEALTKVDTRLKEMDEQIKGATMEDTIDMVDYTARRAFTELERAENETFISKSTKQAVIDEIRARSIGQVLQNEAIKQGIQVDKAKIKQMSEQIAQGWKGLEQGDTKNAIEIFKAETSKEFPGLFNVMGKEVNKWLENFYNQFGGNRTSDTHKMK